SAVPVPDPRSKGKRERILLTGDVPSPISPPSGCRFHTRCWKATEVCKTTEPPLLALKTGHQVACHHPENAPDQVPESTILETAREAVVLVDATPAATAHAETPDADAEAPVAPAAPAPPVTEGDAPSPKTTKDIGKE
ncbi:MAG TPA: oligopeptide/dipeptide ABC transporter ATP-binding protein, partial [Streptomyces sp.]|nr:oligopeptide/dipeptide ABC transporter ATP-binding protein [Streptomyces sp.]